MSETLKLRLAIFFLDILDLVAFLFFVVGLVLTVRFFVFNPFTVVGQSMHPTFDQWDFIIVDKITPKYGELHRWDILVFVPEGKDVPFIKRLVGMPGETIVIKNGNIYQCTDEDLTGQDIDGSSNDVDIEKCVLADDSYLPDGISTRANCKKTIFPIQENGYFMVGDNRWWSTDSRCCFGSTCYDGANYVAYPEDIIGKVSVKLYPDVTKY